MPNAGRRTARWGWGMISAASGIALWHTGRATGILSVLLLSVVIVLGVLVNQKGRLTGLPRFALSGLHRNISLLAVAFVAVHVLTAVVDPSVTISVAAVFVPFVSAYQRGWIGLGAVSIDLFAAVTITSLVRQRIGQRTWLAIHWLAYAAWPVALIHGLGIATDLHSAWGLVLTWGCVAGVALAVTWRLTAAVLAVPRGDHRASTISAPIRPAAEQAAARARFARTTSGRPSATSPGAPDDPANGDDHRCRSAKTSPDIPPRVSRPRGSAGCCRPPRPAG